MGGGWVGSVPYLICNLVRDCVKLWDKPMTHRGKKHVCWNGIIHANWLMFFQEKWQVNDNSISKHFLFSTMWNVNHPPFPWRILHQILGFNWMGKWTKRLWIAAESGPGRKFGSQYGDFEMHYIYIFICRCCLVYIIIILYYTILYYTILYYTILYYTILYYTILYYTIPYHTIPYHTILYYTILYYSIPYYTIPYYTILHDTMLY